MAADVLTTSELEREDSHALAPRQPLKEFDILSVNPLAYAPELPEVVHPLTSRCQPSGF